MHEQAQSDIYLESVWKVPRISSQAECWRYFPVQRQSLKTGNAAHFPNTQILAKNNKGYGETDKYIPIKRQNNDYFCKKWS